MFFHGAKRGTSKLTILVLLTYCFCVGASQIRAQGILKFKCKDAQSNLKKSICNSVASSAYREDSVLWDAFELTVRQIDLNGDGKREAVVWESSWSGTSGGSFWVLAKKGREYIKVLETDMTWSPIILLKSKTNGWNDIVYHVTGGGVTPQYVTMTFKHSKYHWKTGSKKMPKGEILIGRNWGSSVFGPITK